MSGRMVLIPVVAALVVGALLAPSTRASEPDFRSEGLSVAAGVPSISIDEAVTRGFVDSGVAERVATGPTQAVVTFDRSSGATPAGIEQAADVEVTKDFRHVDAAVVTIDSSRGLEELLREPGVTGVYEVRRARLSLAEALPYVSQPTAASVGYRGAGSVVAIFDSGVDYRRAAFGSCAAPGAPGCKVLQSIDMAPDDGQLDGDSDLHGTNVSGIVVGVAPDARIVVADVTDLNGDVLSTSVLAAVDWIIGQKRAGVNIKAVNMSFGSGNFTSACSDVFGFRSLISNGIQPVASAGNSGYNPLRGGGIESPGCISGGISVGMVYAESFRGSVTWPETGCRDTNPTPDLVVCTSMTARILSVLAPGFDITAAGVTLSGTSMSSPMVAGAIAVLASAAPSAAPAVLKSAVLAGPQLLDRRIGLSFPRLDLVSSLRALGLADVPNPPEPTTPTTAAPATNTTAATTSTTTTTTTQPSRFGLFGGLTPLTPVSLGPAPPTPTPAPPTVAPPAPVGSFTGLFGLFGGFGSGSFGTPIEVAPITPIGGGTPFGGGSQFVGGLFSSLGSAMVEAAAPGAAGS